MNPTEVQPLEVHTSTPLFGAQNSCRHAPQQVDIPQTSIVNTMITGVILTSACQSKFFL